MAWFLSVEGEISGPHEEDEIVGRIRRGLPAKGYIREDEEGEWVGLETHPPFADALRRYSPTLRISKPPPR